MSEDLCAALMGDVGLLSDDDRGESDRESTLSSQGKQQEHENDTGNLVEKESQSSLEVGEVPNTVDRLADVPSEQRWDTLRLPELSGWTVEHSTSGILSEEPSLSSTGVASLSPQKLAPVLQASLPNEGGTSVTMPASFITRLTKSLNVGIAVVSDHIAAARPMVGSWARAAVTAIKPALNAALNHCQTMLQNINEHNWSELWGHVNARINDVVDVSGVRNEVKQLPVLLTFVGVIVLALALLAPWAFTAWLLILLVPIPWIYYMLLAYVIGLLSFAENTNQATGAKALDPSPSAMPSMKPYVSLQERARNTLHSIPWGRLICGCAIIGWETYWPSPVAYSIKLTMLVLPVPLSIMCLGILMSLSWQFVMGNNSTNSHEQAQRVPLLNSCVQEHTEVKEKLKKLQCITDTNVEYAAYMLYGLVILLAAIAVKTTGAAIVYSVCSILYHIFFTVTDTAVRVVYWFVPTWSHGLQYASHIALIFSQRANRKGKTYFGAHALLLMVYIFAFRAVAAVTTMQSNGVTALIPFVYHALIDVMVQMRTHLVGGYVGVASCCWETGAALISGIWSAITSVHQWGDMLVRVLLWYVYLKLFLGALQVRTRSWISKLVHNKTYLALEKSFEKWQAMPPFPIVVQTESKPS